MNRLDIRSYLSTIATIIGSLVLSILFLVIWISCIGHLSSSSIYIGQNNTCIVLYPIPSSKGDTIKYIVKVNGTIRITTSSSIYDGKDLYHDGDIVNCFTSLDKKYTSYHPTYINIDNTMGRMVFALSLISWIAFTLLLIVSVIILIIILRTR